MSQILLKSQQVSLQYFMWFKSSRVMFGVCVCVCVWGGGGGGGGTMYTLGLIELTFYNGQPMELHILTFLVMGTNSSSNFLCMIIMLDANVISPTTFSQTKRTGEVNTMGEYSSFIFTH